MLVLRREKGESIMIGDDIEITVYDFKGKEHVRLAISAPRDLPVHRKEIYEAIKKQEKKI